MLTDDHPVWFDSKIPPKTLEAINIRYGQERREYLASLIESYELKSSQLVPMSREQMEKWSRKQGEHLQKVISELHAILDIETSGSTTFNGETYNGSAFIASTTIDRYLRGRNSYGATTPDNQQGSR